MPNDVKTFDPREWLQATLHLRDAPEFWAAFETVLDEWSDIAHFKYEESRAFDERWAAEELELDLHTGQVLFRDLHWLRQTFEADTLARLALDLAPLFQPGRRFELLEGEAHAIVADVDREVVFDLKWGHELSPAAALALVGEPAGTAALVEANHFLDRRVREEQARLDRLTRALGEVPEPGDPPVVH